MVKTKVWKLAAVLTLALALSACQGELVPGVGDDTAQVTEAVGAPEDRPEEGAGAETAAETAPPEGVPSREGTSQAGGETAPPLQGTEQPGEGAAETDGGSGGDDLDDQAVSGIPATDPAGEVTPQVTAPAVDEGLPITGACLTGLTIDELNARGENVYQGLCADCHGEEGEGLDAAPALIGNEEVNEEDVRELIEEVVEEDEHDYVPEASDEDLAAALTYVRNHFGNGFVEVVCPEQVRAERSDDH